MCMEDVRIGRDEAVRISQVSVTGPALGQLCGGDQKRIRLAVSADGVGAAWVGPRGITPANGSGWALPAQDPSQVFRVEEFGRLVTEPWQVFVQVGTVVFTVIEASLEKV